MKNLEQNNFEDHEEMQEVILQWNYKAINKGNIK